MRSFSKLRFSAEVIGAMACIGVFVATLIQPQWFELLFDQAPDGGDGSLEAYVALACALLLAVLLGSLARLELRRARVNSSWRSN